MEQQTKTISPRQILSYLATLFIIGGIAIVITSSPLILYALVKHTLEVLLLLGVVYFLDGKSTDVALYNHYMIFMLLGAGVAALLFQTILGPVITLGGMAVFWVYINRVVNN